MAGKKIKASEITKTVELVPPTDPKEIADLLARFAKSFAKDSDPINIKDFMLAYVLIKDKINYFENQLIKPADAKVATMSLEDIKSELVSLGLMENVDDTIPAFEITIPAGEDKKTVYKKTFSTYTDFSYESGKLRSMIALGLDPTMYRTVTETKLLGKEAYHEMYKNGEIPDSCKCLFSEAFSTVLQDVSISKKAKGGK